VLRRLGLTAFFAVAFAALLAGPATAATPSLLVAPMTVGAGGSVHVSGTCEHQTSGFAISRAFQHDSTHDFAGVGAVSFATDAAGAFSVDAQIPSSTAPGTYTVSGRCGGANLGVERTLIVTAAAGLPTSVPAGSGGRAATTSPQAREGQVLLGGIGLLLLAGGVFGAFRATRAAR
jgi:hypothetical protein